MTHAMGFVTHTQNSDVCLISRIMSQDKDTCRQLLHLPICFIPLYSYLIRFESIHSQCPLSVESLVQCSLMGVMSEDLGHWSTFHTA